MAERRENGHAEIGTRVRVITESPEKYHHYFAEGTEGRIVGFQWGFATVQADGGFHQQLNPEDYEVID